MTALIVSSITLTELDRVKRLFLEEIDRYSTADQGFLLAMTGIRIMTICQTQYSIVCG